MFLFPHLTNQISSLLWTARIKNKHGGQRQRKMSLVSEQIYRDLRHVERENISLPTLLWCNVTKNNSMHMFGMFASMWCDQGWKSLRVPRCLKFHFIPITFVEFSQTGRWNRVWFFASEASNNFLITEVAPNFICSLLPRSMHEM